MPDGLPDHQLILTHPWYSRSLGRPSNPGSPMVSRLSADSRPLLFRANPPFTRRPGEYGLTAGR